LKKHIIITKLFDTGGSNTHLKLLLQYLGEDNVILILEDREQLIHLKNIATKHISFKIISNLHAYAHLSYRFTTNIKELGLIIKSLFVVWLFYIKHGGKTLTISSVEPEKHLYLLWLPFIRVNYILHTSPPPVYTSFTTTTCNSILGKRKSIIAVSQYMKRLIADRWKIKPAEQSFLKVIPNSLPESDLNKPPLAFNANLPKTVLTIGRVDGNKNPEVWLQVALAITSKYPDVNFKWLGNGPDFAEFKNYTANHKRVSFEGLITNPKPYLAGAYLYYQPSITESQGIAVLEAMSAGLPCIVSNAGGLPESVTDGYNGLLVDALDVDEHMAKMIELFNDTAKRNKLGQNGFNRYNEVFSYPMFKEKMDTVYA
jgi:glycosyltransferase involved in cell wall biosynthesis